jgi:hypothetical protein
MTEFGTTGSKSLRWAASARRATALRFVLLLGVVSFFADMTYEGGRSVGGPFLAQLGASATAVGIVSGLGELVGYGLRLAETGALVGPLLVALALHSTGNGYQPALAMLLLPAIVSLVVLFAARREYPRPSELEVVHLGLASHRLPALFWLYVVAGGLLAAGYADFALLAYHFAMSAVVPPAAIPILYALAMAVAALSALAFGRLLDRAGLGAVVPGLLSAAGFAPLAFLGNVPLAVTGVAMWGLGMGIQDSTLRAALAGMVQPARRASAYGAFDALYGMFWFLGSALMGVFYDRSIRALAALSLALQLASLTLFGVVSRRMCKAS